MSIKCLLIDKHSVRVSVLVLCLVVSNTDAHKEVISLHIIKTYRARVLIKSPKSMFCLRIS